MPHQDAQVIAGRIVDPSTTRELFVVILDYSGDGTYWVSHMVCKNMSDAEDAVAEAKRNFNAKSGLIIKVMVPVTINKKTTPE